MKLELVPVDKINVNWNLNRERDDAHVRAIASHINERGFDKNYPVRVIKMESDGSLHLAAGFHRLAAAAGHHIEIGDGEYQADMIFTNLPISEVWAEVVLGDFDKLVDVIQRDNFKHDPALHFHLGLALTRDQKKEQCLRLLMFPKTFKKDVRELGAEFGIGKSTAGNWKDVVCERVLDIAEMQLSDEQLLNQYSLTPGRFADMLILVEGARRASADKKDGARARAKAEFETSKSSVEKSIDDICEQFFTLNRADVERRLFSEFGIFGGDIADMSSEQLKKERSAFAELQADLEFPNASLWMHEFRGFHNAYQLRSELEDLGPNFEVDESARALERVREIETARFESQPRDARLTELESLGNFLPGVIDRENAEREKQVKAHDELQRLCGAAAAACSSLVKEFRLRAADRESYRDFLARALEFPKKPSGYSDTLTVAEMTNPSDLKNTGRAYAVQGVAEKLRADLTSDEPPGWMSYFLKPVVSRAPVQPTSEKSEEQASALTREATSEKRNEQASAPVLPKPVYDPGALNLPPRPPPEQTALSEKGESESEDVRAPAPISESEQRAGAVGARASVDVGNSDLGTDSADTLGLESDLQTAADAVSAILPVGERGRGDVTSHISEKVFKEKSLSAEERLAVLRDLILRDLQVLQTARLTSKKK